MAEPAAFKYRAFISYSHADTSWVKWLHRGLEGFRIDKDLVGREMPTGQIPKTLRPIFRDRADFTAGLTLTDQTLAVLDASAALIVICSPASAKSRYVNEELRLFKSRHPERPVIPLIVDGKPGDPELECFPPSLKFKLGSDGQITAEVAEILAADAREEGDGKNLALAKMVAGLLGVSADEVFRRAERERRRRQQRWIAGLSAVALALAGLAVWAEINRREAVAQRAVAEEQKKIANERRQEAERNFEVAKQGANSLVFDIAQALRDQQGMRTETVRKILGTAEQVIDKLVTKSQDNPELLHVQAAMLNEFAQTYAAQGDTAKEEESARKTLAIAERLARTDPANATWQNDLSVAHISLGDALFDQGNLGAALKTYQDSVAISEQLPKAQGGTPDWQRKLGPAYERIGGALVTQGNLPDALKAYQKSLAIIGSLAEEEPGNLEWQGDLAVLNDKVGHVLESQGDLASALKTYGEGLDIRERLAKTDPGNADWQYELGISHERIGDVLVARGDLAGALKSYQVKESIISGLAKTDPDNAGWQHDLSIAYTKIGDAQVAQGKLTDALDTYQAGLAIAKRLAKADSGNARWQRHLAAFYSRIGPLLLAQGDPAQALKSYQESRAITEGLANSDPTNLEWQHDLSITVRQAW
jgi:tetratricopeptide (TPR) repeat protein